MVNIAERIAPDTQQFGPYHRHLFRVVFDEDYNTNESRRAIDLLKDRFPEPDFCVTVSRRANSWFACETSAPESVE
jgi:hypothetical protein